MDMKHYMLQKNAAKTKTTEPTLTDQTGANDTLITTIVRRATVGGEIPQRPGEPQYLDWRQIPTSLVDMIKLARSAKEARRRLPKALQEMTDEQLYKLTYDELKSIVEPKPADPPADPGKPKEGTT